VAYHRWFGTLEDRDALVPRAPGVSGTVSELSRGITGNSFTLGAVWRANERVDLGIAFETAPGLHDDYTQWQDDSVVSLPQSSTDVRLPARVLMGVTYRPRNTFRTTFALDAVYTPWSDLEDPLLAGTKFFDTWDVRFGLEHVYYNALPGRIGFRYAQAYGLEEADRATLTFGIGYRPGRVAIDLSGELGKRTSRQAPLWPRDEQGPAVGTGRDRVEDTVLRVVLGADIRF
jgi:long-subunit fatty acid transport protein